MTVLSWVQDFRSTGKYDVSIPVSAFIFHLSFQGRQSASCAIGEVVDTSSVEGLIDKGFPIKRVPARVRIDLLFELLTNVTDGALFLRLQCLCGCIHPPNEFLCATVEVLFPFYSPPIEGFMALNFET